MPTTEKHSPRPWTDEHRHGAIYDSDGEWVLDVENDSDRALIVAAVNGHAALVAENQRLRVVFDAADRLLNPKLPDGQDRESRRRHLYNAVLMAKAGA